MHYNHVPSCLAQNWASSLRISQREILLCLAMSDSGTITTRAKKPGKKQRINTGHILFEITNPARAERIAKKLIDGKIYPPITVQEYRFQHILYYIPIESNHRAGAACYLDQPYIMAYVVSTTDVTGIPFMIGQHHKLLIGKRTGEFWKESDFKIESMADRITLMVMKNLYDYNKIRKLELKDG